MRVVTILLSAWLFLFSSPILTLELLVMVSSVWIQTWLQWQQIFQHYQDVLKVYLDGLFPTLLPFVCFYLYQRNYSENGRCYEPEAKEVPEARIRKGAKECGVFSTLTSKRGHKGQKGVFTATTPQLISMSFFQRRIPTKAIGEATSVWEFLTCEANACLYLTSSCCSVSSCDRWLIEHGGFHPGLVLLSL